MKGDRIGGKLRPGRGRGQLVLGELDGVVQVGQRPGVVGDSPNVGSPARADIVPYPGGEVRLVLVRPVHGEVGHAVGDLERGDLVVLHLSDVRDAGARLNGVSQLHVLRVTAADVLQRHVDARVGAVEQRHQPVLARGPVPENELSYRGR